MSYLAVVVILAMALIAQQDQDGRFERWRAAGMNDALARNLMVRHADAVATVSAAGAVPVAAVPASAGLPAWFTVSRPWVSQADGSAVLTWADRAVLEGDPAALYDSLATLAGEGAFVVEADGSARLATGILVTIPAGIPVGAVGARSAWR